MKRSLIISLVALGVLLAAASFASAQGHVFVGTWIGDLTDLDLDLAAGVEYQFTPELALGATVYFEGDDAFDLGLRYGQGTGFYGNVGFWSGKVDYYGVGWFFEDAINNRLDYRVSLGVYSIEGVDAIRPDAEVDLKYRIADRVLLMGTISSDGAIAGVGYEF